MRNGAKKLAMGVLAGTLLWGCDDDDDGQSSEETDGMSMATTTGSSAAAESSTTGDPAGTSNASTPTTGTGADVTSGDPSAATSDGSSSDGETSDGETGIDDGTTGDVAFDEEFIWVADFLRANCVECHFNDANGALILPAADITNDEVRLALEGVTANTGLLLVEPGDRNASQTYLQITNEFGAQFPEKQTNRFGDWIDAGANYLTQ